MRKTNFCAPVHRKKPHTSTMEKVRRETRRSLVPRFGPRCDNAQETLNVPDTVASRCLWHRASKKHRCCLIDLRASESLESDRISRQRLPTLPGIYRQLDTPVVVDGGIAQNNLNSTEAHRKATFNNNNNKTHTHTHSQTVVLCSFSVIVHEVAGVYIYAEAIPA